MDKKTRFTGFAELPLELRLMIWRYALPDTDKLPKKDDEVLFPYRKGFWHPRPLEKGDKSPDRLGLTFCFDMLKAEAHSPLLFVNFKARSVALAWFRVQRLKADNGAPFHPKFGVLYIEDGKIDDFANEPLDRLHELDMAVLADFHIDDFAVSEEFFFNYSSRLAYLFNKFSSWPTTLFVVYDAPRGLPGDPSKAHRQ